MQVPPTTIPPTTILPTTILPALGHRASLPTTVPGLGLTVPPGLSDEPAAALQAALQTDALSRTPAPQGCPEQPSASAC